MSDQKDQSSSNAGTNLPGPRSQFPDLFPPNSSTQTFQSVPGGLVPIENPTRVIRTSDASRPFGCSVCGGRFMRKVDLETHARSHTNERPFACRVPGCGARFTTKGNLNRHERTHGESSTST
ncbi:hypothetical protein M422DRAFT_47222 [Sphaerobolus stellatus SS14]|uniref:C2H2-type domain-containing protein n=1 Tax=Sphaerobolus stellatus (strain SS14) TaxID=990650 RepID=A0A0C9W125_SPHS4|nr:hypothetical protein M422DRAFT_47222 [Sphaerobolus stellatus SS14]